MGMYPVHKILPLYANLSKFRSDGKPEEDPKSPVAMRNRIFRRGSPIFLESPYNSAPQGSFKVPTGTLRIPSARREMIWRAVCSFRRVV